jgi:hypothetical protein
MQLLRVEFGDHNKPDHAGVLQPQQKPILSRATAARVGVRPSWGGYYLFSSLAKRKERRSALRHRRRQGARG